MTSERPGKFDVCVVGGAGRVGLPLAISLANAGKTVVAYDINKSSLETIATGTMPFLELGAEVILKRVINKTLFVSCERSIISASKFVVLVIGTPVDEHLNPNLNIFNNFIESIIDQIHDHHHIILRSTVYPGTTEKTKKYLESKGKHCRLSFCPERIAQGKAMEELRVLPQLISSFDEESLREVRELFSLVADEIVELAPVEAELGKLFTNVWRYITFAVANQFYQIAAQNDVDFYKVYKAIRHNYPRIQDFPKAGFAAGPCLFKDTMQLTAYSNNTFLLGHVAMLINEGMPNFIVDRIKYKYNLKDKTAGILGMAFKADNDDNRESLSYKLRKILQIEARKVLCSDVYIKDDSFVSPEELVKNSEIIILGTPHKEYRSIYIPDDKILIDIWDFYERSSAL